MANEDVRGSGNKVKIIGDVGSALLSEVVDQLNKTGQQMPVSVSESVGAGGVARVLLGSFRYKTYLRNLQIINAQNNDLTGAATVIRIRRCAITDCDMVAGPASPTDVLTLTGFATGAFPAKSGYWSDEIAAGATGVTDAKSGSAKGYVLDADQCLYAEFVNNEGAGRSLIFVPEVAITDFVETQPRGLQRRPHTRSRDFSRSTRKADDQ